MARRESGIWNVCECGGGPTKKGIAGPLIKGKYFSSALWRRRSGAKGVGKGNRQGRAYSK